MPPTLPQLIERHSIASATLSRCHGECWAQQRAAAEREVRETWAEMSRRFPGYVAGRLDLAAWRKERERLIRAGEEAYGADVLLGDAERIEVAA